MTSLKPLLIAVVATLALVSGCDRKGAAPPGGAPAGTAPAPAAPASPAS
jgi:hypothetical protein